MKAVISTTYSDTYLYFLPIVTWSWNRLGVDVVCFLPELKELVSEKDMKPFENAKKVELIVKTISDNNGKLNFHTFIAPEHKEATYAQCSRLYGACLELPEDEILITGDVDMAMFQIPPYIDKLTIFGSDLVPVGQFPMCYASGTVKEWRAAFDINWYNKTYQFMLDELLGAIEADHFRGNYWGKDQQTLWENVKDNATLISRARPNTQFAAKRVDRDDINWRSYVNDELVDAHLWREGFKDGNFENIMELLTIKYPNDNFKWLINYNNAYKQLL